MNATGRLVPDRPLWRCPVCEREFANRNQTHACGRNSLDAHLTGKSDEVRRIFDAVCTMVNGIGPVRILPEKTRIAFQVRMSFAQLTLRKLWVDGHVVLARSFEHPRFRSIQTISPRNQVHFFRLSRAEDVDADVRRWFEEAYAVGQQRHLIGSGDLRDKPVDRFAMLSLIAVIAVMVPGCWFGETLTRLSPDSPEPSYVVRSVAGAVALLAWSLEALTRSIPSI